MSDFDVQVLIVGGGACGLSASVLLSDLGVDHLVVERYPVTSPLPKAHYLSVKTMEVFRQHGLAQDVYAAGMPMDDTKVRWVTTLGGDGPLDRRDLMTFDAFGGGGLKERYAAAAPGPATNLPQTRLEPILRRHAEARAPGRVRFGHELVEFSQDEDGVSARIRVGETGEVLSVRSEYMIAADGGRTIAPAVGVTMQGPTGLANLKSLHITADLRDYVPGDALITYVVRPGSRFRFATLRPHGPSWGRRCEDWGMAFAFRPDDTAGLTAEEVPQAIRDALNLPKLDVTVHRAYDWRVERVVAEHFRYGRVFLAGDAAHRHVPTNGFGLNSAVHDAHNLAWKLAAVLNGRAGTELLDTYEAERRPVDIENADWALFTFGNGRFMDAALGVSPTDSIEANAKALEAYLADTPMGATLRARGEVVMSSQRVEYEALDREVGYVYESAAVVPDGSTPPERDPLGAIYSPVARAGHRLPHAWLAHDGRRVSTHDLVGPSGGFCVITNRDGAEWQTAARAVAMRLGCEIDVAVVNAEPTGYSDLTGVWEECSGIAPGGAVVVRPDNHVGYRCLHPVNDPEQALEEALSRICHISAPVAAPLP